MVEVRSRAFVLIARDKEKVVFGLYLEAHKSSGLPKIGNAVEQGRY